MPGAPQPSPARPSPARPSPAQPCRWLQQLHAGRKGAACGSAGRWRAAAAHLCVQHVHDQVVLAAGGAAAVVDAAAAGQAAPQRELVLVRAAGLVDDAGGEDALREGRPEARRGSAPGSGHACRAGRQARQAGWDNPCTPTLKQQAGLQSSSALPSTRPLASLRVCGRQLGVGGLVEGGGMGQSSAGRQARRGCCCRATCHLQGAAAPGAALEGPLGAVHLLVLRVGGWRRRGTVL